MPKYEDININIYIYTHFFLHPLGLSIDRFYVYISSLLLVKNGDPSVKRLQV